MARKKVNLNKFRVRAKRAVEKTEVLEHMQALKLADEFTSSVPEAEKFLNIDALPKADLLMSTDSLRSSRDATILGSHDSLIRISSKLSNAKQVASDAVEAVESAARRLEGFDLEEALAHSATELVNGSERFIVSFHPDDTLLVRSVKETLLRVEITVEDIYAMVGQPDYPWLQSEGQAYNYIYALRTPKRAMNFETFERWMYMLGCNITMCIRKLSTSELRDRVLKHLQEDVTQVVSTLDPDLVLSHTTRSEIMDYVQGRKTTVDLIGLGQIPDVSHRFNYRPSVDFLSLPNSNIKTFKIKKENMALKERIAELEIELAKLKG